MKKYISGVLISIMIISEIFGQQSDSTRKTSYAVEFNQFFTSSGFVSGTELYFTIIPDYKKNISIGLYFSPEYKKITGFTVHHERALRKKSLGTKQIFNPFAFYNLIYRKTTIKEVLADKNLEGDIVTYTSLEHHIGVGIRIFLVKGLYFKSEVGYGVYLGSIKKPSAPNPITGEITGTNGFGAISKVGITYNL
jgi:hypothetical protein